MHIGIHATHMRHISIQNTQFWACGTVIWRRLDDDVASVRGWTVAAGTRPEARGARALALGYPLLDRGSWGAVQVCLITHKIGGSMPMNLGSIGQRLLRPIWFMVDGHIV